MGKVNQKKEKRIRRHRRVRAKIAGNKKRPRLCVFKSNKFVYAQLIDDSAGKTIFTLSDKGIKALKPKQSSTKEKEVPVAKDAAHKDIIEKAFELGKMVAKKAVENKIEKVVFDRGGYKYHGIVKSLAQGAREGGLIF